MAMPKMADMGKLDCWTRHDAPNMKRPFYDHSQVISKNMHFSYLLTTIGGTAPKTLQVASGHACPAAQGNRESDKEA